MDGYRERMVTVDVVANTRPAVDVAMSMAGFSEQVTVAGQAYNAASSSAEAQLAERKNAKVITDNMGSQEMRANGDSDAAAAMQRVTGLSVVDNQYVFVRGLGERYSNTTLAGAVIPTTEPDKKVVPLDLFPTALVDSVQVAKSYSPDKSAEFAGGLVQIVPLKFPSRPVFDVGYGFDFYSTATGKSILESPLNGRDWLGFDDGARALPGGFPDNKIVRRGIFTPDVGYSPDEITAFGRALDNTWQPRGRTALGPELVGGVRQPLRQARRDRQRAPLLQGELRRREAPLLPHGGGRRARSRQRLRHPDRHRRGPSSASSATSRISSRPRTGSPSRTSTRTRAATRAASSRAPTPRTSSSIRTTASSSSRKA